MNSYARRFRMMLVLSASLLVSIAPAGAVEPGPPNELYDLPGLRRMVAIVNALFPATRTSLDAARLCGTAEAARRERVLSAGGRWGDETNAYLTPSLRTAAANTAELTALFGLTIDAFPTDDAGRRHIDALLGDDRRLIPPNGALDYLIVSNWSLSLPWLVPFDAQATRPSPFFGRMRTTNVPSMHVVASLAYTDTAAGTFVIIPLRGGFSLRIFEPPRGQVFHGRRSWSPLLTPAPELPAAMHPVALQLPKFQIVQPGRSVLDQLTSFGIQSIHSRATPDDIIQSATLDVTEGGLAATSRTIAYTTHKVRVLPPKLLVVDHEFLFAVMDEQQHEPLLLGSVYDLPGTPRS